MKLFCFMSIVVPFGSGAYSSSFAKSQQLKVCQRSPPSLAVKHVWTERDGKFFIDTNRPPVYASSAVCCCSAAAVLVFVRGWLHIAEHNGQERYKLERLARIGQGCNKVYVDAAP